MAQSSVGQYKMIIPILKTVCLDCVFWFGLARAFDLKRAGLYAIMVQLAVFIVQIVSLYLSKPQYDPRFELPSSMSYLCWIVPLCTFLWTAFPNKDRFTIILFGVSGSLIGYLWSGFAVLNVWLMQYASFLGIRSENSLFFLQDYLFAFLNSIAETIIVIAFISHLKNYDWGFRDKLIELDHQYSNGQALLIYWGMKILLLGLPFGILQDAARVTKSYGGSSDAILLLIVFIKTLISLVSSYFAIQFFRKFMLQHLYSRGIIPSFMYWFMMMPIVGLFVFWATLRHPLIPISERIQRFEQSSKLNNKESIILAIIILQLISMFWGGFNGISFALGLISIGFFWFFIQNELALQMVLGLGVLAIMYMFLGKDSDTAGLFAFGRLAQSLMMYVLIGVFHIDSFEYLPALEPDETLLMEE